LYLAFTRSHVKRILAKYRLDRMPGTFSDYGYEIVYWGSCPFLSKEKKCTIYDDRPPECRSFPIITGDDDRLKVTTECHAFQTVTRKDIAMARNENARLKADLIKDTGFVEKSSSRAEVVRQAKRFAADLSAWDKTAKGTPCAYVDVGDAIDFFKKAGKDGSKKPDRS
jgi:Fe-S-cluster containining protein